MQRHVTMVKQADRWYAAAEGGNTLSDRPQETHDPETNGWELRYKMFEMGHRQQKTLKMVYWKAPPHSKTCIQDEAILFPT